MGHSQVYDYLIIGGGPSGLYCAKRIEDKLQRDNDTSIMILEKNRTLGGRTRTVTFHGQRVYTGAGVGRYHKDRILKSLVKQCSGTLWSWHSKICFDFKNPVDTMAIVQSLKSQQDVETIRHKQTFQQFFLSHYPKTLYQRFCWTNGYTDFQNADVLDTLYDYGFEDNIQDAKLFAVPWNKVTQSLKSSLKKTKIRYCREMMRYDYDISKKLWTVQVRSTITEKRYVVKCRKLVLAGFLDKQLDLNRQIGTNSFIRVYHHYDPNTSQKEMQKTTKCPVVYRSDIHQKTIRMSTTIEMTSYADNTNADRVYAQERTKRGKIDMNKDTIYFYWKNGTHYYKPLSPLWATREEFIKYAQNPKDNLYVIGELVSRNQGWTEGAFESVEKILSLIVKKK